VIDHGLLLRAVRTFNPNFAAVPTSNSATIFSRPRDALFRERGPFSDVEMDYVCGSYA